MQMETIPVVISDSGEVYLNDSFELAGHQWFEEGNFSTAEIPANEPSREQFKLLAQFPDSANGILGIYLAYWEAII